MLKHFRMIPFIAGLAVGFYLITAYKTEPRMIYEYPHPSNVDTRTYRDKNDVCYGYSAKEVNCDQNEATVLPYPVQT